MFYKHFSVEQCFKFFCFVELWCDNATVGHPVCPSHLTVFPIHPPPPPPPCPNHLRNTPFTPSALPPQIIPSNPPSV